MADYTAALTRAPGSVCAYQGRGQAYLAQGNTQQALADVAKGLRTKPASLQLLVLRGRANKQAKLYDAAVADFSQALTSKSQSSLQPNDRATIHSERALVLLELDRSADARADVDEALRIAPENASAIAAMGSVEEQSGRKPEAIAFYSRALAIKPDLEDAKRGLERLTLPKVAMLPTPPTTPEPALETLKDDKPASEKLALPAAIPPGCPTCRQVVQALLGSLLVPARGRLLGGDAVHPGQRFDEGKLSRRRQKCPTYEARIRWPTVPIATVKSCSSPADLRTSRHAHAKRFHAVHSATDRCSRTAVVMALSAGLVPPEPRWQTQCRRALQAQRGPPFPGADVPSYSSHLKIMEK